MENISEKPIEKLERLGTDGLKNEDLIALMLRKGYAGKNGVEFSAQICLKYPEKKIFELSFQELSRLKGIGKVNAAALLAGFEFARRLLEKSRRYQICSPRDALGQVHEIRDKHKEHFIVLYVNARNELVTKECVSIGILDASLVHPREVFAPAIKARASGVIFAHNHPSGNTSPSDDDRKLTKRLVDAGKLLGIEVLDHLVVTEDDFYSFKEEKAL